MPEPEMRSFLQYFKKYYAGRPEVWTLFPRKGVGLTTNNHLESMHSYLKNNYLDRKQNQRLDKLIRILFEMTHDRLFDHVIELIKGKTGHRFTDVGKRHRAGMELVEDGIEQKGTDMWLVTSQSSHGVQYAVEKINSACSDCRLRCRDCDACVHHYTCTWMNYMLHFHMCIYMHAVSCTQVQTSKSSEVSLDYSSMPCSPSQEGDESFPIVDQPDFLFGSLKNSIQSSMSVPNLTLQDEISLKV